MSTVWAVRARLGRVTSLPPSRHLLRAKDLADARYADEITVADIIVAVDEPIDATGCGGKEDCMGQDAGKCMTHDLWTSLNSKMIEYLDSISLRKLVDDQLAKGVSIEEVPIKRAISSVPRSVTPGARGLAASSVVANATGRGPSAREETGTIALSRGSGRDKGSVRKPRRNAAGRGSVAWAMGTFGVAPPTTTR